MTPLYWLQHQQQQQRRGLTALERHLQLMLLNMRGCANPPLPAAVVVGVVPFPTLQPHPNLAAIFVAAPDPAAAALPAFAVHC